MSHNNSNLMKKHSFVVTKSSGEEAPFVEEKLRESLRNVGGNPTMINEIVEELRPQMYGGIPTKRIYKLAFKLLRKRSRSIAARYHLKRAIIELGPTGYPFERFVAELFRYDGYSVRVGQIVQGQCVQHEIDVIAERGQHRWLVECKHHTFPGTVNDVKIPLYIYARFLDVSAAWQQTNGNGVYECCVVTNTRFTADAMKYGSCGGLRLISWDYPSKFSLKEQIDRSGLYPLTCLTSLFGHEKRALLDRNVVLCRDIAHDDSMLRAIHVSPARIRTIQKEAEQLTIHSEN